VQLCQQESAQRVAFTQAKPMLGRDAVGVRRRKGGATSKFEFDVTVSSAAPTIAPSNAAKARSGGPPVSDMPESEPPGASPLTPELAARMQRYWQAANYLTVGQIYLTENPLLREPLRAEHIKPRLLGHWGTSPGLSFMYVHLNRIITERDANIIYLAGPGHGGPAIVANVYLGGTYIEVYPAITSDVGGLKRLFRQFSTPGGFPAT
jgi:hypothetical protein